MRAATTSTAAAAQVHDDDPVALVDALLDEAIRCGASDLHFDPTERGGTTRMRRDGFFVPGRSFDAPLYERCLGRLKLLGGVVAYRSDVPQEGRIDRDGDDDGTAADLRLSVLPTPFGEKAVVRVFQADRERLSIDTLGFDPEVREPLLRAAERRAGLVLVTGPCSSGKTTTLYAMVREILNARRDHAHVVSLEDPIECRLPGVTQLAVDERRGTTFAVGLKVLLRQDPNVIFIGEIRDAETARIACEAAFTGHLVLSSMHVGDPTEVILRLLHMGIEPYILASSLDVIVNQRLPRATCESCHASTTGDCATCLGSGWHGRFPIGDVTIVDDDLRAAIIARADRAALETATRSTGGLRASAERAVANGRTTVDEIERVLGEGRP